MRICITAIASLATLITVVMGLQWFRASADGIFILTPGGEFCAVAVFRGRLIAYRNRIDLGAFSHQPTTIQTFSVDPDNYLGTRYDPQITTLNFIAARVSVGDEHSSALENSPPTTFHQLIVPFWTWLALALPLPTFTAFQFARSRRRRERGLCQVCGYDLRSSPTRCPECGTLTDKAGRNADASGKG